jgi:hypothetical protein
MMGPEMVLNGTLYFSLAYMKAMIPPEGVD